MVKTIEWANGKVVMLDQTRLPIEVVYKECDNYLMVAEGIKKLWIRGAPAIGIAAAMGIALAAQEIEADNIEIFTKKAGTCNKHPAFHQTDGRQYKMGC